MPDIYFSLLLPSQFLPFGLILSAAFILLLADAFLSLQPAGLSAASWRLPGERDPLLKKLRVGIRRYQQPSLLHYLFFFFLLSFPSLALLLSVLPGLIVWSETREGRVGAGSQGNSKSVKMFRQEHRLCLAVHPGLACLTASGA